MTDPDGPATAHPRPVPWWRGGADPSASLLLVSLGGAGAGLVVGRTATLVLVNLHGPFGERAGSSLARVAALAGGLLAALAAAVLCQWVGRRSLVVLVGLMVAGIVSAVVLVPTRVDVHESFLPQPNARWSCTGWRFSWYPPATYDAETVDYCIGLERRLPDG